MSTVVKKTPTYTIVNRISGEKTVIKSGGGTTIAKGPVRGAPGLSGDTQIDELIDLATFFENQLL